MKRLARLARFLPLILAAIMVVPTVQAQSASNVQLVTAAVTPPFNTTAISATNPLYVVQAAAEVAAFTDCSGTITSGGTAQTAQAVNTTRKYLFILNPASASETLWINITGTATASGEASGSIALAASQSFLWSPGVVPSNALSVLGATTAHKFVCTFS